MLTFTLDTNCIIALEKSEPEAAAVRDLAVANGKGAAEVALVSVSASERQPGDTFMENYSEFTERAARTGLDGLRVLPTIAYFGLGFWDVGLFSGTPEMMAREKVIHETLFATIPFAWADFAKSVGIGVDDGRDRLAKPWRNAFCDRQMFWAHDHNRRDVFVTSDANFRRKLSGRPDFLGTRILRPSEAVTLL